jgi:hypothetical protein
MYHLKHHFNWRETGACCILKQIAEFRTNRFLHHLVLHNVVFKFAVAFIAV